ncbi:hypothetical protein TNCV_1066781 [Trichonephila clavipes]|uniref:Uncharacterized protein n=1 Tax=Trichonephila clavipes TaxID=2585209 RepID=A0A8X6UY13_TRICX|nr:hypothetical protein TNCV_1066781 [Trichonephila clavipes]
MCLVKEGINIAATNGWLIRRASRYDVISFKLTSYVLVPTIFITRVIHSVLTKDLQMRKVCLIIGSCILATYQATPFSLFPSCWPKSDSNAAPDSIQHRYVTSGLSFVPNNQNNLDKSLAWQAGREVVDFLLDERSVDTSAWRVTLPRQRPTGDCHGKEIPLDTSGDSFREDNNDDFCAVCKRSFWKIVCAGEQQTTEKDTP